MEEICICIIFPDVHQQGSEQREQQSVDGFIEPNLELIDAVRDCVSGVVDSFAEGGLTDWSGWNGRQRVNGGVGGHSVRMGGIGQRQGGVGQRKSGVGQRQGGMGQRQGGVGQRKSGVGRRKSGISELMGQGGAVSEHLALLARAEKIGSSQISVPGLGVFRLGGSHFGSVLDRSGQGSVQRSRSFGQSVGQDAESVGVGHVADADLLAFRIDVSVAAHLVTEGVAVVDGGLSGMRVAERGLAQLILRVVLVGGKSRSVGVRISVVEGKLGLGSHGHQQNSNLDDNIQKIKLILIHLKSEIGAVLPQTSC